LLLKHKHLPFLSALYHTLYTVTQTEPQSMLGTDQPSAPQTHRPHSAGSENWGSHCHPYPADKHNYNENSKEPSAIHIIAKQLQWTNNPRTTVTSYLRKHATLATCPSCMRNAG
jgi:hypothetical protein